MIMGVGIDLLDIQRMENILRRNSQLFLQKLLSHEEYMYAESIVSKHKFVQWIAGRYAAKEAVLKACGTGFDGRVMLYQIQISTHPSLQPSVILPSTVSEWFGHSVKCALSISYTRKTAMGIAYLEQETSR
ncbi:MAG: holo-ACP synthase [Candidatus Cohnella colombiensis]|uniref:Holo-[acyl-carrier-protein] synthase n=1 Tax=Candidatus Cohnella colombiensis TaxID=3121368 RepID=A0AA95EXQ4_9BACL|nr:MAG: holo-ACP synthase [Cohnella sp.]